MTWREGLFLSGLCGIHELILWSPCRFWWMKIPPISCILKVLLIFLTINHSGLL